MEFDLKIKAHLGLICCLDSFSYHSRKFLFPCLFSQQDFYFSSDWTHLETEGLLVGSDFHFSLVEDGEGSDEDSSDLEKREQELENMFKNQSEDEESEYDDTEFVPINFRVW